MNKMLLQKTLSQQRRRSTIQCSPARCCKPLADKGDVHAIPGITDRRSRDRLTVRHLITPSRVTQTTTNWFNYYNYNIVLIWNGRHHEQCNPVSKIQLAVCRTPSRKIEFSGPDLHGSATPRVVPGDHNGVTTIHVWQSKMSRVL